MAFPIRSFASAGMRWRTTPPWENPWFFSSFRSLVFCFAVHVLYFFLLRLVCPKIPATLTRSFERTYLPFFQKYWIRSLWFLISSLLPVYFPIFLYHAWSANIIASCLSFLAFSAASWLVVVDFPEVVGFVKSCSTVLGSSLLLPAPAGSEEAACPVLDWFRVLLRPSSAFPLSGRLPSIPLVSILV